MRWHDRGNIPVIFSSLIPYRGSLFLTEIEAMSMPKIEFSFNLFENDAFVSVCIL